MGDDSLSLKQIVFADLERELAVTRTVLERLPQERFEWKPHEKSMTLGRLASHVADLPGWVRATIDQDELDVATAPRPPADARNSEELLDRFDRNVAGVRDAVGRFDVANLDRPWTLRNGQQVMVTRPRLTVYRLWCMNHLIHHRAQLCMFLRLMNVPVPTVYFNTADDPTWVYA